MDFRKTDRLDAVRIFLKVYRLGERVIWRLASSTEEDQSAV